MISITVEPRDRDEWELASKLFKIIEESQPNVKGRLGFGSDKTKKTKDFHSQLVDAIAEKLIDYYNPGGKILWGREFIEKILQFEEEAADEIFGDE